MSERAGRNALDTDGTTTREERMIDQLPDVPFTPLVGVACHGCNSPNPSNFSTAEEVFYCDRCVLRYADAGTDIGDIEARGA